MCGRRARAGGAEAIDAGGESEWGVGGSGGSGEFARGGAADRSVRAAIPSENLFAGSEGGPSEDATRKYCRIACCSPRRVPPQLACPAEARRFTDPSNGRHEQLQGLGQPIGATCRFWSRSRSGDPRQRNHGARTRHGALSTPQGSIRRFAVRVALRGSWRLALTGVERRSRGGV